MSNIIWPDLPNGWELVKLREIVKVKYGEPLPKAQRNGEGKYPVYSSGGVTGKHDQAFISSPTIVIGRKGSAGSVHLVEEPCWCIDTAFYMDDLSDQVDIYFLTQLLKFVDLSRFSITVGVPGLNRDDLYNVTIPIPPLEEQQYIVEILQQADELRRLRQDSLEKAEKLASALFLEMFGDPEKNPYQWPVQPFGSFISSSKYGPRFPNASYSEIGVHILRTTDMNRDGSIRWWESPKIDLNEAEIGKNALKPKTLVFSRSGTIGPVALYMGSDTPCVSGAYLIEIELNDNIHPEFAVQYFLSDYGQYHLVNGAKGATQKNLNVPTLRSIPVFLPEKDKQLMFVQRLQEIRTQKQEIIESQKKIEKLLVSISVQAFVGKLTEKWREKYLDVQPINLENRKVTPMSRHVHVTTSAEAEPSLLLESRRWLWGELSQFQKTVLWQVNKLQGYLTEDNLDNLIIELPNDINHDQEQKIKKTLEQLVALGLLMKVSVQGNEGGFVTAYRALRDSDDSKTEDMAAIAQQENA